MKIINGLFALLIAALAFACEEHVIEYDAETVGEKAQFQLHYIVPVASGAANDITKVEINGQLYSSTGSTLTTYNAIPSGGVGLFYTVDPGLVNIKLYKGPAQELVYNQDTELTVRKQNVFVHDFNLPPIVLDNEYPYPLNLTMNTDSAAWVRFYNFLYETPGNPTTLRLQYQYIDPRTTQLVNLGDPIGFGEATGWEQIRIIKTEATYNTAGTNTVPYRVKVVDDNGNIVGDLQIMNSSSNMVNYAATASNAIGRKYHHIFAGYRAATPLSSVRQFTAN